MHTIVELNYLQRMHTLTDQEQRLVFEKQMEIFQRIREWHLENEQLGLAPDLTDTWTPEQRERFLREWNNDEVILQANREEKRSYDEMMDGDEPVQMNDALQLNRGEKRSYDEMLDHDEPLSRS